MELSCHDGSLGLLDGLSRSLCHTASKLAELYGAGLKGAAPVSRYGLSLSYGVQAELKVRLPVDP